MSTTLTAEKIADLKKESHALKAIVQIGKNGLTQSTIDELLIHMKKRKLVKVKILKSALDEIDKDELIFSITKKTKSELILKAGFVVVLYKR